MSPSDTKRCAKLFLLAIIYFALSALGSAHPVPRPVGPGYYISLPLALTDLTRDSTRSSPKGRVNHSFSRRLGQGEVTLSQFPLNFFRGSKHPRFRFIKLAFPACNHHRSQTISQNIHGSAPHIHQFI